MNKWNRLLMSEQFSKQFEVLAFAGTSTFRSPRGGNTFRPLLLVSKMVLVSLLLSLNASLVQAQAKDMVYPKKGGMMRGEIESVTADFISLKKDGSVEKIAVDQIDKVRFGDEPTAMSKIRSDVENNKLEDASDRLKKVKAKGRAFVQQDIAFYKALTASRLALQGDANITTAARQMKAFLDASPNSIRYYEACEVMGELAMNLGKFDSAASNYARLTKSKSPATVARGNLLQGDAWLLRGEVKKAGQKYQLAARSDDTSVKLLGTVGVAKCLASTGKTDAAIKQLEKVIAENDSKDIELFARAYNALGHAYKKAGDSNAALDAYLHTDLLFYRERSQHAEALYELTQLWGIAKKPSDSARARKKLKEGHAASLWAKK